MHLIRKNTIKSNIFYIFFLSSQVLIWETRPPRGGVKPLSKKEREIINPMGVPLTFKHLDLIWKPLLRVNKNIFLFLFNKRNFFFISDEFTKS